MKYPHWFCYLLTNDWVLVPCAVMLISEKQAICALSKYIEKKDHLWAGTTPIVEKFESLEDLLRDKGLTKEDMTILTDDERGKCVAFTYCDEPGGRCGMDYYDCGCFY